MTIVSPLSDQLLARNGPKPTYGWKNPFKRFRARKNKVVHGAGGGRAGDEIRVNRLDSSKNVYLKDIFFRDIFVFGDIFFIAP